MDQSTNLPDSDHIIAELRRARARFAFVFGSQATGRTRPDSDLDVAAWFGGIAPDSWEVAAWLPGNVDLVVLDDAPLELAGRVAMQGQLLFDDDPPARVQWQAQTRLEYLDERPRTDWTRRLALQAMVERGRR